MHITLRRIIASTFLCSFCFILFTSCQQKTSSSIELVIPTKSSYLKHNPALTQDQYYDKVLGALVGSAIGDAMGASTEMWHRDDIQKIYGYITTLTPAKREKSPEGTWGHNLDIGTTTDDTRWKYLMTKYFTQHRADLNPTVFAKFITEYYAGLAGKLSTQALAGSDSLDQQLDKVHWMIEWDRVAKAYLEDPATFQDAKSRFYGGEMSCAGMLYSPMFGLTSGSPEEAYHVAFDHSLFDLGYARDITATVAAMTNVALKVSDIDSILQTIEYIDPQNFRNSRLIGRLAASVAKTTTDIFLDLEDLEIEKAEELLLPDNYPYGMDNWRKQNHLYQFLEEQQMPIAFHAGEIWQILMAGMKHGDADFNKTMEFIVNYGRDNDTVAAVAGMILGAMHGYTNLPMEMKQTIVKVNKVQLGIDLEELAGEIVQKNI